MESKKNRTGGPETGGFRRYELRRNVARIANRGFRAINGWGKVTEV